jgi:hypothetical protein
MSHSHYLSARCQHWTSGTHSSGNDGQRAGCTSCSDRISRRSGYPLRRRTGSLARVADVRTVLCRHRALSTDLVVGSAYSDHYAGARRWIDGQRRSPRGLGLFSNCGSTVRPTRRGTRTGASRRPLRSAAADLCRDGSRLGLVPRSPKSADTSACQRDRLRWRRCRHRSGVHCGSGFGSTARGPCAGRCRTRPPRAARRTCTGPSR